MLESDQFKCNGCEYAPQHGSLLTSKVEKLLDFLADHNLILREKFCDKCGGLCTFDKSNLMFVCGRTIDRNGISEKCAFQISIRKNTWFDKGSFGISLDKLLMMTTAWVLYRLPRIRDISVDLKVPVQAVVNWSSYCRRVCEKYVLLNGKCIGGEGKVVEVDECKLGYRKLNEDTWIIGGIERGSSNCFIAQMPDRSALTLLQVLMKHILPGTTLVTDLRKVFHCIPEATLREVTLNHPFNFIDPMSGEHTQTIRRMWREVRQAIPKFNRRRYNIQGYIAEYLWKREHSDRRITMVHCFLQLISQVCPPK